MRFLRILPAAMGVTNVCRSFVVAIAPLVCVMLGCLAAVAPSLDAADYEAADDLKYVLIDSSDTESFLSHRHDTEGRMFVGGREALFVYEPTVDDEDGKIYGPRQLLYRFPNHTWIYDIAIRGNDVYVLTMSALYVIPDARTRREGLEPKLLLYGIPQGHVHQCFHGLAWGPEGDLYLCSGDPTWYMLDAARPDHWGYWTYFSRGMGFDRSSNSDAQGQRQGAEVKTHWNGVGGAFRIRPDGTRFQVFTTGLRNSCGLAFDEHFNLFTNDNDHEGNPIGYVPGRMLHLTPGSDMVWPRGWMMFKTPDRRDIIRTMFDGMGRGVPVGQTYYNEPHLPERFRHNLLVARWGARKVTRYPLVDRGASFRTRELDVLKGQNLARPVGVSVGRDGRIFASIAYMKHNEGSPTYKSDLVMITGVEDKAPYYFQPYDAVAASVDKLYDELELPYWWRRYRAHVELQRRGATPEGRLLLGEATARLSAAKANSSQAIHLVHLAAASKSPVAGEVIQRLTVSKNAAVRQQAYRALAEYPELGATQATFVAGLADGNQRVELAALEGLFRFDGIPAKVVERHATSDDTYLRQAAVRLLTEKASIVTVRSLCESDDVKKRLAGILTAGRMLTVRPATAPLDEDVPLGKTVGPVVNLNGEKVDLRERGRIGTYRIKDHWRHAAHTIEEYHLFNMLVARLDDDDLILRQQAATFLNLLDDKRSNDKVAKVRADATQARLAARPWQPIAEVATSGPFPNRPVPQSGDLFGPGFGPEQRPVDVAAEYDTGSGQVTWTRLSRKAGDSFAWDKILPADSKGSAYFYFQLESGQRQQIELDLGADTWARLWHNGSIVWTTPNWYTHKASDADDRQKRIAATQQALPLELQPGTNAILLRVLRSRDRKQAPTLKYRSLTPVVARVPTAEQQSLATRLQEAMDKDSVAVPGVFFEYDWVNTVKEGNVAKGRRLFESIGCNRCHATRSDVPVAGGPSLANARERFSVEYLAESVLVPSRQVSPLFRSTLIVTKDGRQHRGLVVREDGTGDETGDSPGAAAGQVELLLADGSRQVIRVSDIEERQPQMISPMPSGLVKTPEELRDILAFLLAEGM